MWLFKDVNLLSSSTCKGGDHVLWKTTVTDNEGKDHLNNVFTITREVRGNLHALMFFHVLTVCRLTWILHNYIRQATTQHMRCEVDGKRGGGFFESSWRDCLRKKQMHWVCCNFGMV